MNYYSTQTLLEWSFNHYFYRQSHFTWVAAPFYPYKHNNPASSNPYKLYAAHYEPWVDRDDKDLFPESKRTHITNGVQAKQKALGPTLASGLRDICERIDQLFLYPILYRVDN